MTFEKTRLNYEGTKLTGLALAFAGGASLITSYFHDSLILTVIGLGLTFWGALFLYITHVRTVPEDIISAMPISMIKALDKLLAELGYNGRCNFIYPRSLGGLTKGYIFLSAENSVPDNNELMREIVFHNNPKGILLPAPSHSMVDLYEKILDLNFALADMKYLAQNLPKLLVEDLKLADQMSMTHNGNSVRVNIVGRSLAALCDNITRNTVNGERLGCPICSSLALVFAKTSGRPVLIKSSKASTEGIKITYELVDQEISKVRILQSQG